MIHRLIRKGKQIAAFLKPMGIPLHSAYTAFFLILSLFPSLLLLLGLLRYTRFDAMDLMGLLEGFLPESLYSTVKLLVDASFRHSSSAVISVSVIAGLWSASRGMYGLVRGLNKIYCCEHVSGYWRNRVRSVIYTSLFLSLLILILVLHVFGTALVDFLWMTTDPTVMLIMNLIDLRFLFLLLLQTALFSTMYALLPPQAKPPWRMSARGCDRLSGLDCIRETIFTVCHAFFPLQQHFRLHLFSCVGNAVALFLHLHPLLWRRFEPLAKSLPKSAKLIFQLFSFYLLSVHKKVL